MIRIPHTLQLRLVLPAHALAQRPHFDRLFSHTGPPVRPLALVRQGRISACEGGSWHSRA